MDPRADTNAAWVTPALAHAIAQASIDHDLSTEDVCAWLVDRLEKQHLGINQRSLIYGYPWDGPCLVPLIPPQRDPLDA